MLHASLKVSSTFSPQMSCDPHADPHGETSGRKQWNIPASTSSIMERKAPESLAAQRIEASKAVGKDEVGSSNLPSSSIENRYPTRDSGFSILLVTCHEYPLTTDLATDGYHRRFFIQKGRQETRQK